MLLDNLVFYVGLIGFFAFSITAIFNWKVYKRMKEDQEQTLEYFMLRDQIIGSMKSFVVASILFVLGVISSLVGIWTGKEAIASAALIASSLLIIAYMGFFLALFIYTHPKGKERFF